MSTTATPTLPPEMTEARTAELQLADLQRQLAQAEVELGRAVGKRDQRKREAPLRSHASGERFGGEMVPESIGIPADPGIVSAQQRLRQLRASIAEQEAEAQHARAVAAVKLAETLRPERRQRLDKFAAAVKVFKAACVELEDYHRGLSEVGIDTAVYPFRPAAPVAALLAVNCWLAEYARSRFECEL